MLAHKAEDEGIITVEGIAGGNYCLIHLFFFLFLIRSNVNCFNSCLIFYFILIAAKHIQVRSI